MTTVARFLEPDLCQVWWPGRRTRGPTSTRCADDMVIHHRDRPQ
jgi:hypothetical protein